MQAVKGGEERPEARQAQWWWAEKEGMAEGHCRGNTCGPWLWPDEGGGRAEVLCASTWQKVESALAGVAQWIEQRPVNQRVISLIPSQGTCLGCGPGPQ